ncbi:MAG: hypothetical protein ACP5FP_10910, partial [Desulfuromonadaceae bacterium]
QGNCLICKLIFLWVLNLGEDVDLLFLSNEEFENLIVCHPYLGLKLLRSLFRMTSKRLSSSYSRIASLF